MVYKKLKIGYFADGKWAHEAFKLLAKDKTLDIRFICVRYDTSDEVLKQISLDYNIDYLRNINVNSEDFINEVKKYQCDIFVSMSFNQIFKNEIINLPTLKTINCHAGKLPFYRGRNILNWVLINDEKDFGITVHYVDEGIDTGDIILQRVFPITDDDNYETLLNVAHVECANVLYEAIKLIQSGNQKIKKQVEIDPIGFYCGMRQEGDESLDWNQTSREIFNFVRAISKPGPMARTQISKSEVKINRVKLIDNAPIYKGIVGQVVGLNKDGFLVKTLDSIILVSEYEYDGKIKVGDRLL